jgi:hypothetical protein
LKLEGIGHTVVIVVSIGRVADAVAINIARFERV